MRLGLGVSSVNLFLITGANIMVYTNRPLETSPERQITSVRQFGDRVHWGAIIAGLVIAHCGTDCRHATKTCWKDSRGD